MGLIMQTALDRLKNMNTVEIETFIRLEKKHLQEMLLEGDIPNWVISRVEKDIERAENWLAYIKGGDVERLVNE